MYCHMQCSSLDQEKHHCSKYGQTLTYVQKDFSDGSTVHEKCEACLLHLDPPVADGYCVECRPGCDNCESDCWHGSPETCGMYYADTNFCSNCDRKRR